MKKIILSLLIGVIGAFGAEIDFYKELNSFRGKTINWLVCEMDAKKPYCIAGNGDLTVSKVNNALKGSGIKLEHKYDNSVDNNRVVRYSGFLTTKDGLYYRAVEDTARDTVETWSEFEEQITMEIVMDNSFNNGKLLDINNSESFKGIKTYINGSEVDYTALIPSAIDAEPQDDLDASDNIAGFPNYAKVFSEGLLEAPARDYGNILYQFHNMSDGKVNIQGYKICYTIDIQKPSGVCFNGGGYPNFKVIESELSKRGIMAEWMYALDNNPWWSVEIMINNRPYVLRPVIGYEMWDSIAINPMTYSGQIIVKDSELN